MLQKKNHHIQSYDANMIMYHGTTTTPTHHIYRGDFRILSLSSPQPNIQTDIQLAFFSHTQITCIYTHDIYINMYEGLALRTESMIVATNQFQYLRTNSSADEVPPSPPSSSKLLRSRVSSSAMRICTKGTH